MQSVDIGTCWAHCPVFWGWRRNTERGKEEEKITNDESEDDEVEEYDYNCSLWSVQVRGSSRSRARVDCQTSVARAAYIIAA